MNVVLIVLDTLRRDHLGCYGYGRDTSPRIDRLAREGVTFDRCYATDVPTIPSFTALLSGQLGIRTGKVSFNATEPITPEVAWMPTLLSAAGVTTAMVSTLAHMGSHFPAGFQHYLNPMAGARHRTQTVEAEEINRYALPWLESHYRERFFLFVHYWDPHVESVWGRKAPVPRYKAPREYQDRFAKRKPRDPGDRHYVITQYDANIAYADSQIGVLLDRIEELGIRQETMIVFITDHGENLGETHPQGANLWDHLDIHEPVIHIPLIIRHPGIPRPRRVSGLVQNVDVAPTILKCFGVPAPEVFDGADLTPMLQGRRTAVRTRVFSDTGFFTCKRALITEDGWKLIKTVDNGPYRDGPMTELFDLGDDPGETRNLAARSPRRLDALELEMTRWVEARLGGRPDPLRLRAHMGSTSRLVPYYGYIYLPQHLQAAVTAKPSD